MQYKLVKNSSSRSVKININIYNKHFLYLLTKTLQLSTSAHNTTISCSKDMNIKA